MADTNASLRDEFKPTGIPDTVATPEGDNEALPDEPLSPSTEATPTRPRGNEPHPTQPIRPAQL